MRPDAFMLQQREPNNSANSSDLIYVNGNDVLMLTMGPPHESGNLHAQGDVQGSAQMRKYHQGPPDVLQHPQHHVLHQGVPYAPNLLEHHMKQFPSQLRFELSELSSRVETQFPVTFTLSNAQIGVERVRLPRHLISKPRYLTENKKNAKNEEAANPQTLQLRSLLVSADDMESPEIKLETLKEAATGSQESAREVKICQACIAREIKRANRKKDNTKDPWTGEHEKRAVLLSGEEYSTWERRQVGNGKIDLQLQMPVRIACYCRHHDSKQGFCIIFTLVDCQGRWVAQGMTPPIYITDNHKDSPVKREKLEKKTTDSNRVHKRSMPAKESPKERPAKRICKEVLRKRQIRSLQDMPPMGPKNSPSKLAATLSPVCPPTNNLDLNAGMGQTLASHQPQFPSNDALPPGSSAHIANNPQQPFLGEMLPTQQQPGYAYASANTQPRGKTAQNFYNVNCVGMAQNLYTKHAHYASTFGMNPAQTAGANLLNVPGTNLYPNMAGDAGYYHTNGGLDLPAFANTGPHNNVGMGSSNMGPQPQPWNYAVMTPNAPNASALNDGVMGQSNMVPHAEQWNHGVMIPSAANASALNDDAMLLNTSHPSYASGLNNGVMPPNAPNAGLVNDGAMVQSNRVVSPNPWKNGDIASFDFPKMPQVAGGHFVNAAGIALPDAANMGWSSPPGMGPAGTVDTYTQQRINPCLWNTVHAGPAGMVVTNARDRFDPEAWNTSEEDIFDAEKEFDAEEEARRMNLNNFEFP